MSVLITAALLAFAQALSPLQDAPLRDDRARLLDLAFRTASAIPAEPHIKTRSRMQELVTRAALELDQPSLAASYAEAIGDWRRGACMADLAFHAAKHGREAQAARYLASAVRVADGIDDATSQAWRRERIRAKVAKAYHQLGRPEAAAPFEAGIATFQAAELAGVKAEHVDEDELEREIRALEPVIATGDFDQTRVALETLAHLFDRFYEDHGHRRELEEKIKSSWGRLPIAIRVELMGELVECALRHADTSNARALLDETWAILGSAQRSAEYLVPQQARLAALRHRAGEPQKARDEADAALASYLAERQDIIDIYRAGALRPLAEAYWTMGDAKTAREVYARAIDDGVENPNARPRAEDLVATCCSLALQGVEPDAATWSRLRKIHEELREPW